MAKAKQLLQGNQPLPIPDVPAAPDVGAEDGQEGLPSLKMGLNSQPSTGLLGDGVTSGTHKHPCACTHTSTHAHTQPHLHTCWHSHTPPHACRCSTVSVAAGEASGKDIPAEREGTGFPVLPAEELAKSLEGKDQP